MTFAETVKQLEQKYKNSPESLQCLASAAEAACKALNMIMDAFVPSASRKALTIKVKVPASANPLTSQLHALKTQINTLRDQVEADNRD